MGEALLINNIHLLRSLSFPFLLFPFPSPFLLLFSASIICDTWLPTTHAQVTKGGLSRRSRKRSCLLLSIFTGRTHRCITQDRYVEKKAMGEEGRKRSKERGEGKKLTLNLGYNWSGSNWRLCGIGKMHYDTLQHSSRQYYSCILRYLI